MACRSAYNSFVIYHNFRHVIDVLQATFYFLVQIGTLPPYPSSSTHKIQSNPSPIAALLTPFEAFVLLVTAIGHDVGHPGVSNAFLVSLKAPLAQLYNDKSVLEAFHCAAYSQILRRYWPKVYNDTRIRSLLIKSILATDMGLHADYMADAGNLQQKLAHNKGTDGWSFKLLENYKALVCGLLIKCADISNVVRNHVSLPRSSANVDRRVRSIWRRDGPIRSNWNFQVKATSNGKLVWKVHSPAALQSWAILPNLLVRKSDSWALWPSHSLRPWRTFFLV